MKLELTPLLAVAALALGGCAPRPPEAAPAAAATHAAPAHAAPTHAAPALGGPAARSVDLPGPVAGGQPREVRVLVDEPALKLVSIVLRQGTPLPEHHSPVPVTIQSLQGAGTVTAGADRFRIDPTHAVVLAPNVPHAVQPDAASDLVLLVHHLGRGPETH